MSLLKAIKAQLGLSNTPANNFTITAEADNGTLKLARGNAGATTQDILTVDAAGKVTFNQMAQTWQDVKASRVLGNTYINNTGQPIQLCVSGTSTASAAIVVVTGGLIFYGNGSASGVLTAITINIPNGASYVVGMSAGTGTVNTWMELR